MTIIGNPFDGIDDLFNKLPAAHCTANYGHIRVYHGSDKIIEKPVYGKGRRDNDYGLGFYTTADKNMAGEWAVFSTAKDGYINEYELDFDGLRILNLDKSNIKIWLSILLLNRRVEYQQDASDIIEAFVRTYGADVGSYDIIQGYRADDSFFSYIRSFVAGRLSLERLQDAMYLGDLGSQICFKTEKAFSKIKYITSYEALTSIYYESAKNRDSNAREQYRNMKNKRKGTLIDSMIGGDYE